MSNLYFSLEATLPVFLVMLCGFFLMKIGLFNESFTKTADAYVFKCALPIAMVLDLADADMSENFSWKFMGFCFFGTMIMFLLSWLIAALAFRKRKEMIGAFAMSAARGSAAVLGVAFAENIFGNAGMTALMIMAAVPLFNIFSVIFLTVGKDRDSKEMNGESLSGEKNCRKKRNYKSSGMLRDILWGIVTNPLIIAVVIGLLLAASGLKLPKIPYKCLKSIGSTATPLALLSIGAGFDIKKLSGKLGPAFFASFIKLMLMPAIFLGAAVYMGFTGPSAVAILTMAGSPTTVACYIMAKNMDGDYVLTSGTVMLATLLSSVSLTFWLWLLRAGGII